MTELATDLPVYAPLRSKPTVSWLGFEPGTSRADAHAGFYRRFGIPPEQVRVNYIVLAGPVNGGDNGRG